MTDAHTPDRTPISELAKVFLKLGTIAFGGPAAHIAMMEDEIVEKRRWLSREELLDLMAAANLIPGPNSTETAIHIGYARGGFPGLLVAGSCFILPAAFIVAALGWVYVTYGELPATQYVLQWVQPVILVVIAQALFRLGKTACRTTSLATIAVVAAIAEYVLASRAVPNAELIVLGASALAGLLLLQPKRVAEPSAKAHAWPLALLAAPAAAPAAVVATTSAAASPGLIFLIFAKIGAVLFGSGYVLLAFLESEFVRSRGLLTEAQLLDAVAVGQVTPGPVFTTATFIGYILGGPAGAAAGTIGIFAPAFIFVAITGPVARKMRQSRRLAGVLDGVVAGSFALMVVVTLELARAAWFVPTGEGDARQLSWIALVLTAVAGALLWRKVNSAWIILGAAAAGLIASQIA